MNKQSWLILILDDSKPDDVKNLLNRVAKDFDPEIAQLSERILFLRSGLRDLVQAFQEVVPSASGVYIQPLHGTCMQGI